jgi:trimeric autotransporter adhesin
MFSVGMPRLASLCLVVSGVLVFSGSTANAQQTQYSSVHRSAERTLPQTLSGGTKALRAKLAAGRSGISLALADFDGDGTQDLVTGYSTSGGGVLVLQRGSSSATAPSASDWAVMQRGELVSPFVQSGQVTELPVQPDFLKAADINGNGIMDVVVAARGGSSVYVLLGDGKGGFSAPQALGVQGGITALTTWRGPEGTNFIVAGVCSGKNCGLQVLTADGAVHAAIPLQSAADAIEIAPLNGGVLPDFAVAAGGNAFLVDGDSVLSGSPHTETLPVSGAASLATGNFVYDRRGFLQLAVLGSDATLHVLVRTGIDNSAGTKADVLAHRRAMQSHPQSHAAHAKLTGMAWSEAETLSNVGSGSSGGAALMFRTRVSGGGNDDLVVMSGGQFVTVAHPLTFQSGTGKSSPVVTVDSSSKMVKAALPARISPDARFGIISADGSAQPNVALPPINKTFTVTTTTDGTHSGTSCTGGAACSIRDAVRLANADTAIAGQSKVDTISIPAGTYTFTTAFNPGLDVDGDIGYHYDLDASINVVGAGSASTILNGNSLDKIFSADSGVVNNLAPFDVFITGVTMENGTDNNNPNNSFNFFGGLIDWESWGAGNLTFKNDVLNNGKALWSSGGAIFTSNSNSNFNGTTSSTEGLVEIDNSTVSNNSSPEQGGGVFLGAACPGLINNVTFTGNTAAPSVNPSDTDGDGSGGGFYTFGSEISTVTTITNSTFTNNTAVDSGGGAGVFQSMSMSGTSFTGNKAGAFGGGLYFIGGAFPGTITTSNFTGNSVIGGSGQSFGGVFQEDGGAICSQSGESGTDTGGSQFGNLTMHYSRIHGNTGGHSTGLGIGCESGANQFATVNATDNWWGCNGAATGTGCDTAIAATPGTQTLTLTPHTTLTISLNTATPSAGANISGTGSLGQDSAGTIYTTAQDAGYLGVPATLTIVQGSSTVNSSASALDSNASITTTTPATASGNATVTVDGISVSASFSVTSPILKVTSTHAGSFIAGSTGNNYTLSVANSGNASTSGTVTVADTLPSGFTATAISGTGWNCVLGTLTCTTTTVLASSSSLPAITLTVNVSGTNIGVYSNGVAVSGGGSASGTGADLTTVVGPPTMVQAFVPNSAGVNQAVALTFQISNPNTTTALTGIGLVDILPTQMVITTPNGLTNTCGGTPPTAAAGGNAIIISGATLAAGANCTVSVNVVANAASIYVVNSGPISAQNGGLGLSGSAMLTVNKPPTLVSVTPGTSSIFVGGATSLTYVLSNPNGGTSLTGVALTDTLPAGLIVDLPNGASTTCSGGTVTAPIGGSTISLSGATLAANANCSFTVDVFGTVGGNLTFSSGAPTSTNGGTGVALSVNIDVIAESIWLINANDTLVPVNSVGNSTGAIGTAGGVGMLGAVAFDHAGNVWAVANGTNSVIGFTSVGTAITVSGNAAAGVSSPTSLAIDGLGMIWVANGNNTVSVLDSSGAAVTPSTGYKGGLISAPTGIIVDNSGSVWISNGGNGSVTKIIGGAAPVVTPTVTGTLNNTLGTRP